MNATEYQAKAHDFASYGENPMYPALGLAEEAADRAIMNVEPSSGAMLSARKEARNEE